MERTSPQPIQLLLLLLLSGLLFFTGLGSMGLTDRDEGRNAEAGREMFASGDFVTPTFNGELRVAKPVFVYWLMTMSYHVFGVSEFAARAPSALFGVGLIVMHYLFLTRLRGPTVGLFGALMLLLNIEVLALGRMAITDSVLIFSTTLSLYGFWLGLHEPGRGRHWIWAFYAGMAIATLTKGPVGFAVPLITGLLYLAATRQWLIFWQRGAPIAGTLLFLLLAGPWYVAMFLLHGDAYSSQAKVHTVGRFLAPMEGHGVGWWFYFPVLLLGFYPWSAFLPAGLYRAYQSWRAWRLMRNRAHDSETPPGSGEELEWFAGLWVVGVFIFFSLSSTRLPHYIGPLFPACALLAALFWAQGLKDSSTRGLRGSIHFMMGIGYLVAIGSCECAFSVHQILRKDGQRVSARHSIRSGYRSVRRRNDHRGCYGADRIFGVERQQARHGLWGGRRRAGECISYRHPDGRSRTQSLRNCAAAGIGLRSRVEPESDRPADCIWFDQTIHGLLRETNRDLYPSQRNRPAAYGAAQRGPDDDPPPGIRSGCLAGRSGWISADS